MYYFKYSVVLVLFVVLLLGSLLVQVYEQDKIYKIIILYINDYYGYFWCNDYGEYGLVVQKMLVDGICKEVVVEGGSVLLLFGGDINIGVLEFDLQDVEFDFCGMNLIGYDVMVVGNYEFDNLLSVLCQQEKWVKFLFLLVNIYQKSIGEWLFKFWVLFKCGGLKIVVIGLIIDDMVKIGNLEYFIDIEFCKLVEEVKLVIQELQQNEKLDVILVIIYMGYYDNGNYGFNVLGDVEMVWSLFVGLLVMIVGGYLQDLVCMVVENKKQVDYVSGILCVLDCQNGIWIVQVYEWGKYVGCVDFEFCNGEMKLVYYQLILVNLKKKVIYDNG